MADGPSFGDYLNEHVRVTRGWLIATALLLFLSFTVDVLPSIVWGTILLIVIWLLMRQLWQNVKKYVP